MVTRRHLIIATALVVALITAATIAIIITLTASTAATQEQDYRACMTAAGVYETSNTDDIVSMADTCYANVYGE